MQSRLALAACTCSVRIKQSQVAAYFGPSASSIGVKMRRDHSTTTGQPSAPSCALPQVAKAAPRSRPVSCSSEPSSAAAIRRYVAPAYSMPMPNCSMARASGERSTYDQIRVRGADRMALRSCRPSRSRHSTSAIFSHRCPTRAAGRSCSQEEAHKDQRAVAQRAGLSRLG